MKWIALTIVGLAGVGFGWWAVAGQPVMSPSSASSSPSPDARAAVAPTASAGESSAAPPDEALRRRVAALEAEVDALRRTVASIRRGSPASAGRSARGPQTVTATVGDDDRAPRLEGVKRVVRDEMEQMREDRRGRREARMVERLEQRLAAFNSAAGLSDSQARTVGRLLREEQGQVLVAFREARKDMTWEAARAEVEALRERTDERVAEALEPGQLPAYEAAREEGLGASPRRFGR